MPLLVHAAKRFFRMTNPERLLLYTLPRWAGVTAVSIKEPLSDMWLGGEEAGHHAEKTYDPDGYEKLRFELRKDFVSAPPAAAFRPGGKIRTVRDLAAALAGVRQRPVPSPAALLGALLPSNEVAALSRGRLGSSIFKEPRNRRRPPASRLRRKQRRGMRSGN